VIDALSTFPRLHLLEGPTPIQRLHRIEAALGEALGDLKLWVKRDDLMGLGGGGNKLRKLEFLLGDAHAKGADVVITIGARQSNHARLTAAAAARQGLACELVLVRMVPRDDPDYVRNGNILLDDLFGARVHDLPQGADGPAFAEARVQALSAEGHTVCVIPVGGSSATGCLGYAACAVEIAAQADALDLEFDRVILAYGSGGTHAGLAAGFAAMGRSARLVKSFAVLASVEEARQASWEKANATAALLGAGPIGLEQIDVAGEQRGEGYGIPTEAMVEAVRLMATQEGLLLDPVYSGKAFAGLLADVRQGHLAGAANILFLMTGGVPGLYAYRGAF
jgi:D-cysteine desulfhydrase